MVLAGGMMDYSRSAIQQYRAWLSETPPFILTTRDEFTYDSVADLAEHAYNGIDVAFFFSDLYRPLEVVFADDCSTDNSIELMKKIEKDFNDSGIELKLIISIE